MHDHRKLGRELGLFDTDPLIGAGLPYWLPDGATVRHTLEEYIRDAERRAGYRHVYSPCWASGSCTRYRATGPITATTCSLPWTSGASRS
ncbi:hypothetical protein Pth03_66900 [Planotetraspora thailandica]|uniref:Uncharacterized protein n=1 Tax=Planotetraspora thailandica TaxID=487172 RepID=A0A8J3Y016_9ACTN|nr:hypothetical protein [Planotetraspora thailandica]GII58301.1 hypothetical protein Pth03_66900 [Planotetraspora thailandica]